jgi:glutamate/tyrosine decarboxylase-like PLP-dependent enzyme
VPCVWCPNPVVDLAMPAQSPLDKTSSEMTAKREGSLAIGAAPEAAIAARKSAMQASARHAVDYIEQVNARPVGARPEAVASLHELCGNLPEGPTSGEDVVNLLAHYGSPATSAISGGRYFGFVIGGCLPAAMGASWLVSAWDQNAGLHIASPVAAELEETALEWTRELLGLPEGCGGAVVTGATVANMVALAAARHAQLERLGWDVENDGLFGAPEITIVIGEEAHSSLIKALGLLGLGRKRVVSVAVDGQGRMRADALPRLNEQTILCLQAGNVNTGAFDLAEAVCAKARAAGAWVHVDGAFGLWAAVSPRYRQLTRGFELADSWATDAHKWPNVGYDCGVALVRDAKVLRAAMSVQAAYLMEDDHREPSHYTPELSRRARGVELWTGLRSLGRSGIAEIVERTCRHARRFAEGLQAAGFDVLNEVVINQVLVSFGSAERTLRTVKRLQEDGTCWCGTTVWQGHTAMRISVSSWVTTDEDVERSLEAMIRAAG